MARVVEPVRFVWRSFQLDHEIIAVLYFVLLVSDQGPRNLHWCWRAGRTFRDDSSALSSQCRP